MVGGHQSSGLLDDPGDALALVEDLDQSPPASSIRPARYWTATLSWIRNLDPQITSVTHEGGHREPGLTR
jgi:hypothetical protein